MTIASAYSAAHETNPLLDPSEYHQVHRTLTVDLADPELAQITRLRLLTDWDCPFYDLSYCHGTLKDGTPVTIALPVHQFSKRKGLKAELLEMCREAGVYGKGLGIFDAISTLS
jgi:hypothetical protein